MKFLRVFVLPFLLSSAYPLNPAIQRPLQDLSPASSFSTDHRTGTDQSSSGSSVSSDKSARLKEKLSSTFSFSRGQSSTFTCHSPDVTSSLTSLATYLTDMMRRYRDELLDKNRAPMPGFEVCLGGWGKGKPQQPSIYLKEMSKRQISRLKVLIEKEVVPLFVGAKARETASGGLVITQERG